MESESLEVEKERVNVWPKFMSKHDTDEVINIQSEGIYVEEEPAC